MRTIVAIVVGTLVLMGGLAWWVKSAMREPPPPANKVVEVQLVRPPPPAPPPPPPPPPPEEQLDVPEPQDVPDIPEPNLEPAADAGNDGPPGEDAFGLPRGNGAGGGGGGPYSLQAHQQWYAQKARDRIRALLTHRSGIKKGNYKVPIRLWIDTEGGLERYELLRSTGDASVDKEIESALAEFGRMLERRPAELPPFRIRVEFRA